MFDFEDLTYTYACTEKESVCSSLKSSRSFVIQIQQKNEVDYSWICVLYTIKHNQYCLSAIASIFFFFCSFQKIIVAKKEQTTATTLPMTNGHGNYHNIHDIEFVNRLVFAEG